ncbi:alpha/beta fold hydrolase [Cytobacillus sp. FJAT-54145]|uniref:Alpha/beta fold hydrolase n=1 Tax=Cytobacillus spartinae TaxID=3299023 RepID=A0ABW6KAU2_9BACI
MELKTKSIVKKKKPIWKKIFIGFVSIILLVLAFGISYEAIASYQGIKKYPAEGKLVDVGDFKLHINKMGEGKPTIILEAASGASSTIWKDIPEELSEIGTVVTYDRGGYAWSEKATTERTGENIVNELYTALKEEEIEGPYIVVGHSLGGMYARLFAQTYKEEVAGVVLVDSRHEDYSKETNPIIEAAGHDPALMGMPSKTLINLLKVTGVVRLLGESDTREEQITMNIEGRSKFFHAREDELRNIDQVEDSIRNHSLGDIPLTIMTHGIPIDSTPFGISKENSDKMEEIWQEQQKQMLNLSTNSELIVAENSGHFIIHDEPELVINEIKEMVGKIK